MEVLHAAEAYGIDSVAFEEYLREFQARRILHLKDGFISCEVPLFSNWLRVNGVRNINTTINDPEAAIQHRRELDQHRLRTAEISELARKWSVYKGTPITEDKIRSWLDQFGADVRAQRLMYGLLAAIRFYDGGLIRAKMREGFSRVRHLSHVAHDKHKHGDILLSYIDGPGKSGAHYARIFADENSIHVGNIVEPDRIASEIESKRFKVLLFVNDLLGSEGSAMTGLKAVLPVLAPTLKRGSVLTVLYSICAFSKAKESVEKFCSSYETDIQILVSDVLMDSDRAFSEPNQIYKSQADLIDAKTLAHTKGKEL